MMKVSLQKRPGRNMGLYFEEAAPELIADIVAFIAKNCTYTDGPHSQVVKQANPFVQSCWGDFLFLEFWAEAPQYMPLVKLLIEEFDLEVQTSWEG